MVDNVAEELFCSRFKPVSFELGFGKNGELPPVEMTFGGVTISVTGFVDRVDGWIDGGKLHLRVVDYKTGRKTFDLTEVWNGLGLQMLLYLFTLEEKGQAIYGLPVEGDGVLYLPAREAVIRGSRSISLGLARNYHYVFALELVGVPCIFQNLRQRVLECGFVEVNADGGCVLEP